MVDPITAFDTAAWLEAFERVGGSLTHDGNGNVLAGIRLDDPDQIRRASDMLAELKQVPDHAQTIKAMVLRAHSGEA